jgi:hypothetical protein
MTSKIFKLGKHTITFIYFPSHKLFAMKTRKMNDGDRLVELHLGKIGGWYCYRP